MVSLPWIAQAQGSALVSTQWAGFSEILSAAGGGCCFWLSRFSHITGELVTGRAALVQCVCLFLLASGLWKAPRKFQVSEDVYGAQIHTILVNNYSIFTQHLHFFFFCLSQTFVLFTWNF